MAIGMSKSDAILWLILHLEPELKAGGCHLYRSNPEECIVCKDTLATLAEVKKILKVSHKNIMKWDTVARITE